MCVCGGSVCVCVCVWGGVVCVCVCVCVCVEVVCGGGEGLTGSSGLLRAQVMTDEIQMNTF